MRRIGISQRVDVIEGYGERRDSLDLRWYDLVIALGYMPVPIPNIASHMVCELIEALDLAGIILSGGNSIAELDFDASDIAIERDKAECALIQYAAESDIPLLGVCRGMQFINHYFGGSMVRIEGHVGAEHELKTLKPDWDLPRSVNSFHHWAIQASDIAPELIPIATDRQGHIEAFTHNKHNMVGIMWHPERAEVFDGHDINLLKRIFL